jgi:hypothetical protein
MASVGDIHPAVALASAAPASHAMDNAAYLSSFPDVRSVTPVAMASASTVANASPGEPIFRSLFQAGERTDPVSPKVRELWGNSSSLTSVASTAPTSARTPELRAPRPLDLFSDRSGTFS